MVGVIGIVVSLILLMYLAYRGITVLVLAPILALFAAFMGAGANSHLMATYTEVFMKSFAGYAKQYFPVFMLGAIFGKIMDDSGCAKAIAHFITRKLGKQRAMLAVALSCAVLTYGGVSMFVVAFAIYPIAVSLFREADIPKRLIPGTIAVGSFGFTMTALPGSPQIQNVIPMPYFGTNAYAAPFLGLIASAIMFGASMVWLLKRAKKARNAGEGYGNHLNENVTDMDASELPSFTIAIFPILLVLVINFVLSRYYFVDSIYNGSYLSEYNTKLSDVSGMWSLIIALVISIIVAIIFNFKRLKDVKKSCNQGAIGSLLAIINTSSEVGYGNVIKTLAAFAIVKNAMLGISSNPLIAEAISCNVLAGITGSASGGMAIALSVLGDQYLSMAHAAGISPGVLHRIATIACGGFDSLPHNGAVITLLGICQLTHKESYKDIGMVSVLIPICTLVIIVALASLGFQW